MAKRITTLALYTAAALAIHVAEAWIPLPVPVPGVKPGFANTVTLFMLFYPAGPDNKAAPGISRTRITDVLSVLLCRIFLAAFIAGRPVMLAYSLAGGLFAVTAQILFSRILTDRQVWVCGAAGAVSHNIGQVMAAIIITGTPAIAVYLPMLIIAGIFTGTLTGLAAGFAVQRLSGRKR